MSGRSLLCLHTQSAAYSRTSCGGAPVVLRQPFAAYRAVESFCTISGLLKLSRVAVFKPDTPFIDPMPHGFADIFWIVVTSDHALCGH